LVCNSVRLRTQKRGDVLKPLDLVHASSSLCGGDLMAALVYPR
jgi:hypothetical protein